MGKKKQIRLLRERIDSQGIYFHSELERLNDVTSTWKELNTRVLHLQENAHESRAIISRQQDASENFVRIAHELETLISDAELPALNRNVVGHEQTIGRLNDLMNRIGDRAQDAQNRVSELETSMTGVQNRIADLGRGVAEAKRRYNDFNRECTTFSGNIHEFGKRVTELTQRVDAQTEANGSFLRTVEELKKLIFAELPTLNKNAIDPEQWLGRLNDLMSMINDRAQGAQNRIDEIVSVNVDIKKDVEHLLERTVRMAKHLKVPEVVLYGWKDGKTIEDSPTESIHDPIPVDGPENVAH